MRSLGGGSGSENQGVMPRALFPWADTVFAAGGLAACPWGTRGCGGPGTTQDRVRAYPLGALESGVPSRRLERRWCVLSGRRFRGPWSVTVSAWTMGVGGGLGDLLPRVTRLVLPALSASGGRDVAQGRAFTRGPRGGGGTSTPRPRWLRAVAWLLLGRCGEPGSCVAPGHVVREDAGRGMVAWAGGRACRAGRNAGAPV